MANKKVIAGITTAALMTAVMALAPTAVAANSKPGTEPAIGWQPCAGAAADDTVRCGRMSVPVDWTRPAGSATTEIQLARLPAAQPAQRVGTLFFNPGGPGEGEVGYLVSPQARQYYFPQAIQDRFDIVAVEPRGTGQNPPLNCPLPVDRSVTRFPRNRTEVAALVAGNTKLGSRCTGETAAHLDTASVARDMDRVRAALGEHQVSFLGVSYGTMLAQSYAELFPGHVRALVLDGAVDRSRSWQQLVEQDALAVEDGVERFAQWCEANEQCALHGPGVRRAVTRLLSRADAGQITDQGRAVRAEEISGAINTALNDPGLYPQLATSLSQTAGSGTMGDLADLTSAKNPEYPLYRAIICQDVPVPAASTSRLPAEAAKVRALAPTLRGYSEFWDIASGCAGWPAQPRWVPHSWRVPVSFPPALPASGAHDVATPRPWAEAVRGALPGSALVRWDGDGHAAWPAHSAGTVDAEVAYLTDPTLPAGA